MNMKDANQLSRIYNTLLLIHTSGEDTVIMGECLKKFKEFLSQVSIYEDDIDEKEE